MHRKLPNLRHLLALLEIGGRGSISDAARAVYLSQSALTQAVLRLEHDIGSRFLRRVRRALRRIQSC